MCLVRKLADDCCKYGNENEESDRHVARVAVKFGTAHSLMENEKGTMLDFLGNQVNSSQYSANVESYRPNAVRGFGFVFIF